MPTLEGNLLTIDLVITVFGVDINVQGTVEILGVRKRVSS
jgi:hypothetical protein